MIWALKNNQRIIASPKLKAKCPICKEEVISKCGSIKVWHWSHKKNNECDSFSEGETLWHKNWKELFPKENQEVKIENHFADIKTNEGIVIELQNSPISSEKIEERELFYKQMIWVLNGKTLCKGLELRHKKGNIFTFRWKHPPKSWWNCVKPLYIDINNYEVKLFIGWEGLNEKKYETSYPYRDKIFLIKKVYPNIPCGGWGELIDKKDFLNKFRGGEIDN
jgi:competence protein CoiA